ncbi:MAG: TIGR03960 family B12-binding radical SAM protein [Syntrophaceae bacterium]|nr:TIGR03960 family B12-binding radical SAM protein [Syntrophaceae bacterium]
MSFESLLLSVEKPSRYIGGEVNAVRKSHAEARLSFALTFPDTYEVGMSHHGLQILYAILNGIPGVVAERSFAPWPDMEVKMKELGIPLTSLESRTPLNRFDIVGFSLQYELSYTNVLNMLDLAGIPIRREDRREQAPLIIAGGPCVFNPAPMSLFIDAFAIGEGEEIIGDIAETVIHCKAKDLPRQQILEELACLDGLYVPAVHHQGKIIRKRIITDLDKWRLPCRPVVPLMKTIHDRITLEIARGCTRGCRFCQAGMVWRPVREKDPGTLIDMADCNIAATGYDEISLLSLSSGDYTYIEPLLSLLMDRYYRDRVALALPSLRVETLTKKLMAEIRRVRKTSFTLAPEAGTQRLRNVINKGNTEEELLNTVRGVFDAGWKAVKLYFMIGLPGETTADLEGITEMVHKALREGRNRNQVTVSLSTFVPKPHTPLQWARQITMEETREKQDYFRQAIRNRNLSVKWHDYRMSFLEGILSRGDEQTGRLIEDAFHRGARFDGWSDLFKFDLWEEALKALQFDVSAPLVEKNPAAPLPWDMIDTGLNRDFLIREAEKSLTGELTPDCRHGACYNCGVCDHKIIRTVLADDPQRVLTTKPFVGKSDQESVPTEKRFRVLFTKRDRSRLLSHLEVSTALMRAMKQGGLRFIYSQGFHPHPRISFAMATSVGMESLAEYADIRVEEPKTDLKAIIEGVNCYLPEGMAVLKLEPLPFPGPALSETILAFNYFIHMPERQTVTSELDIGDTIQAFLAAPTFLATKTTRDKTVVRDIRTYVESLTFNPEERILNLRIRWQNNGTLNPFDFLRDVLDLEGEDINETRITKTETFFREVPEVT